MTEREKAELAEIRAGLAHAHDTNPLWRSVMVILEKQIDAATAEVSAPACLSRDFAGGHLAGLRGLRDVLLRNRAAAMARENQPERDV